MIGGRAVETPPMSSVNLLEGLSRTVVYITYSQLITLVMALFLNRLFSEVIYLSMGRVIHEYIVSEIYIVYEILISVAIVLLFLPGELYEECDVWRPTERR